MAVSKESQTTLIAKAKNAFNKKDYATAYRICTELMKGKTASVVVYMHCISSLKLRTDSKEQVAPMVNDTLLLTVALDNFYKQSGKKNGNIETYISEILFTLMTAAIESVQTHYPFGRGRRSFKHAVSDAQETMNGIKVLGNYRLSGFTATLPRRMNSLLNETGVKLLAYIGNWVNIVRDPTNNWLYEDDTDDLFERIVAYQNQVNALKISEPEEDQKEDKSEEDMQRFVSEVSEQAESAIPEMVPDDGPLSKTEAPEPHVSSQSADRRTPTTVAPSDPAPPTISRGTKSGFFKPIDILIGVLVVLFIAVVSLIVIYAIQPSLVLSIFG